MQTSLILLVSIFGCYESLRLTQNSEGSDTCPMFQGKRVMITNVDEEYINTGMFKNWYHYAQPYLLESNVQLILDMPDGKVNKLFAIPELSDDIIIKAENRDFETLGHIKADKTRKFYVTDNKAVDKAPFGSEAFKSMMTRRLFTVKKILEDGCNVLQADIDTAWLANPFKDIEQAGHHSLLLTYDNIARTNICGCFMYMTPKLLQDDFYDTWVAETVEDGNEQKILNHLLKRRNDEGKPVDFRVLPFEYYMPGSSNQHEQAHLIHANWRVGWESKIDFLRDNNVWHKSTDEWLEQNRPKTGH